MLANSASTNPRPLSSNPKKRPCWSCGARSEVPFISAPHSVSPLVTPQPMKIHLIYAKSGAVLSQSAKTPVPAIETLINQRVGSLSDSHPLGR